MVSVLSGTAPAGLSVGDALPETLGYRLKRKLLGPRADQRPARLTSG